MVLLLHLQTALFRPGLVVVVRILSVVGELLPPPFNPPAVMSKSELLYCSVLRIDSPAQNAVLDATAVSRNFRTFRQSGASRGWLLLLLLLRVAPRESEQLRAQRPQQQQVLVRLRRRRRLLHCQCIRGAS
jgi:hypothetical protein